MVFITIIPQEIFLSSQIIYDTIHE